MGGEGARARLRRGRSDPPPPLPVHKETAGGKGGNPTPAEPSLPGLPAPEFLGGHLPFRYTHKPWRFPVPPFNGSNDCYLATAPWNPPWAPSPGRGPRCAAGEVWRPGGEGPADFPRCSLILRGPHSTKGAVIRRTAGLASNQANEFSGSEAGARCQPRYSISKPWRCCSLLLGADPDKIQRSGFPFRHSHRCCLSPWAPREVGSWGDLLTTALLPQPAPWL